MAERVAAGLWPDREAVRLAPDLDAMREPPGARVENVHLGVVASRQPQLGAVGADVSHIRAAAARKLPGGQGGAGRGIDHGHAAWPASSAADRVPTPVGDEQPATVAARINAVRALARREEAHAPEGDGVHQIHAVGLHVGHIEDLPVGRGADVLRHGGAVEPARIEGQIADDLPRSHVELRQLAGELAGGERPTAVRRELHMVHPAAVDGGGLDQRHGARIAEIEPLQPLRDHDRVPPVGGEVEVIRISDGDRHALHPGHRINRRQAVAAVVGNPQRAQVPGRHHVLG